MPEITLKKHVTPWRVVSWEVYIDGEYMATYKTRKDAKRAAEARVANTVALDEQLWQDIRMEHED